MRFIADLNIPPTTVDFLNDIGHDAERVTSFLPPTASDEEILAVAIETQRIVLTADRDFSTLIYLSGLGEPSLVLLRLSSMTPAHLNRVLARNLPTAELHQVPGFMATIQDNRIRVHLFRR